MVKERHRGARFPSAASRMSVVIFRLALWLFGVLLHAARRPPAALVRRRNRLLLSKSDNHATSERHAGKKTRRRS